MSMMDWSRSNGGAGRADSQDQGHREEELLAEDDSFAPEAGAIGAPAAAAATTRPKSRASEFVVYGVAGVAVVFIIGFVASRLLGGGAAQQVAQPPVPAQGEPGVVAPAPMVAQESVAQPVIGMAPPVTPAVGAQAPQAGPGAADASLQLPGAPAPMIVTGPQTVPMTGAPMGPQVAQDTASEVETLKADLDKARRELQEVRAQLDKARTDLAARNRELRELRETRTASTKLAAPMKERPVAAAPSGATTQAPAPGGARVDFTVYAITDGRAWLKWVSGDKEVHAVVAGSMLPDGTRVTKIDDAAGVVATTAGDIRARVSAQ